MPNIPLRVTASRVGTSLRRASNELGEIDTGGGVGGHFRLPKVQPY